MSTVVGIGYSTEKDIEQAARDAAFNAKTSLARDRIDLAIIFSTIHYPPEFTIPTIRRLLGNAKIIGSSTAGIILSQNIHSQGLAILLIHSEEIAFSINGINDINKLDPLKAGREMAQTCLTEFNKQGTHERKAFLLFTDGQFNKNSILLKGLQSVLGNVFPILGAGSTDNFKFEDSFQVCENSILKRSAVGLLLGGSMNVGIGGGHGWRPLGKPRRVDKSEGNVIKIINGQKAAHLYDEYFKEDAKSLREHRLNQIAILYPLGIYVEESKEYVLKNAIDIQSDGSIVCQGHVPEGSRVHIMIGNKEFCMQAAVNASLEAQKTLLGKVPKLIIIIESLSRLKLLGRMAIQEIQLIRNVFGNNVPMIGMYSDGEICPFLSSDKLSKPYLQNESIVVLAIS